MQKARVPEVGMGATVCVGPDRYAATVVEVKLFKTGTRRGEPREITVEFDQEGEVRQFLRNRWGTWREKGWGAFGALLLLNYREESLGSQTRPF